MRRLGRVGVTGSLMRTSAKVFNTIRLLPELPLIFVALPFYDPRIDLFLHKNLSNFVLLILTIN
jgi:hypothetical protein